MTSPFATFSSLVTLLTLGPVGAGAVAPSVTPFIPNSGRDSGDKSEVF